MMLFFKILVILLISDSNEILISEDVPFQAPKNLQQINEILTMHLFALVHCFKNFDFDTANGPTGQGDNSTINCFWECFLTNIDMMKNGHLEYIGSEENKILKDAFNTCSEKEVMKNLEGCRLAHMFLLCEYHTFLERGTIELFSFNEDIQNFAKRSISLLMDIKTKLEMMEANILKNPFSPLKFEL